jgi:serine/threonine protein kinase
MQPPAVDVGIPRYIASGSHHFSDSRYRFLIMPRYKTDLHSILKCGRLSQRHFLIVASQIIDVLQHLHGKHYVHSDIKAENIMIGLCKTSQSNSGLNTFSNVLDQKPFSSRCNKSDVLEEFYGNSSRSHNLRPAKKVAYIVDENSRSSNGLETVKSDDEDMDRDDDFEFSPKKRKSQKLPKRKKPARNPSPIKSCSKKSDRNLFIDKDDERVYVIDYGLATKYVNVVGDTTVHKPFCCDERRAHDGTLEFTSRDAHFGAHSRRSDLECLG